ncbi:MAG: hypothetical protein HGA44_20440, partial [Cellulomonadaceae bacterium]|nr:hypothetical protein [Cellulomonadaceae bacterium]
MRRRRTTLAAVAVVVAVVGAAGAIKGREAFGNRCGAGTSLVSEDLAGPAFENVDEAGFSARSAEFLAAARTLGAPFGELRSGAAFDDPLDVPQVLDAGAGAVLVPATGLLGALNATFTSVNLPTGEARWSRSMDDSNVAGGMVGDLFVTRSVPNDRAPQVIAYDPDDGHQVSCVKLGPDVAYDVDQAVGLHSVGDDVLAVYPRELEDGQRALSLSRVELATGTITWTIPIEHDGEERSDLIDVLGDVAVVSTVDLSNERMGMLTSRALQDDSSTTPTVLAYSTTDGQLLWEFPAVSDGPAQLSQVIGVDEETGTIVVETGHDEGAGLVRTYSGLDASGTVLWSRVGGGWQRDLATVWGSTVVLPYFGPAGSKDGVVTAESGLRGWSATEGEDLWISSDGGMSNAQQGVEVGDQWVYTSGLTLRVIDPATGDGADYPLPPGYTDLTVTDDHLVMTFTGGVLVFD